MSAKRKNPVQRSRPNRAAERISTTRYCVPAAIVTYPQGKGKRMTLEEMKVCGKATLTAADIASVLDCDPHAIRLAAKKDPDGLGFQVICMGSRVKIPTLPFIEFMTKLKGAES